MTYHAPNEKWDKKEDQGFVQTRSETTGLRFFDSVNEAIKYARQNQSVWKISFTLPNKENIRLLRRYGTSNEFVFEPMAIEIIDI